MKRRDRQRLQGVIAGRYMGRFLLQVLIFTAATVLLVILAIFLADLRIWYASDPLYRILSFVRDFWFFFLGGFWLAGMLILLLLQWRRAASGMVALTEAVERLGRLAMSDTAQAGEEVALPNDLRELQELLMRVEMDMLGSRRAAREAEQRKTDMVLYLAHDLKTPLTSVLGYLTLLRDEESISPKLQRRYLEIAAAKAQRLEDLVNEFFDITRFSLKGLTLELSRLNLSRMLEQMADETKPLLEEKNLRIETRIAPEVEIYADAGKLERVIDNLLRNATAYSYPDSAILLELEKQEGEVLVRVHNRGVAIPPHKLALIFEQFYRLDSARSSGEGGAGLGLAIAKEIVNRHGGSITAESQGESIVFLLRLPILAAASGTE